MTHHRSYSDHEIANYVLGVEMPDHAIHIQARLARDDAAAARALKWEAYFLGIVDALPPSPPPAELLAQIQATLGMDHTAVMGESRRSSPRSPRADDDATSTDQSDAPARRFRKQLSTRRLLLAIGVGVAILAGGVLVWASLKPPPPSTVVQQPLHLEPK